MKAEISTGISDDYAVLSGPGFKFYYGYEQTNELEEWLFVGEIGNCTLKMTAEELGFKNSFEPIEEILLAGIGLTIATCKTKSPASNGQIT